MKIELKKITNYQCEYTLTRDDQSLERITLETKTFLLHDICHFAVENNLEYKKGFWGMLSQGYTFSELFGKNNPQTEELRFIEQVVGPIQSVYSGHILKQDFEQYIKHLNFTMTENILERCLADIRAIIEKWEQLAVEQQLILEFNLQNENITTNRQQG